MATGRQTRAGSRGKKSKRPELGARDSDGGIDESLGRHVLPAQLWQSKLNGVVGGRNGKERDSEKRRVEVRKKNL